MYPSYPWKKTSILAFLAEGLSIIPDALPAVNGLLPKPRGLPPTPAANFLPVKADELR